MDGLVGEAVYKGLTHHTTHVKNRVRIIFQTFATLHATPIRIRPSQHLLYHPSIQNNGSGYSDHRYREEHHTIRRLGTDPHLYLDRSDGRHGEKSRDHQPGGFMGSDTGLSSDKLLSNLGTVSEELHGRHSTIWKTVGLDGTQEPLQAITLTSASGVNEDDLRHLERYTARQARAGEASGFWATLLTNKKGATHEHPMQPHLHGIVTHSSSRALIDEWLRLKPDDTHEYGQHVKALTDPRGRQAYIWKHKIQSIGHAVGVLASIFAPLLGLCRWCGTSLPTKRKANRRYCNATCRSHMHRWGEDVQKGCVQLSAHTTE